MATMSFIYRPSSRGVGHSGSLNLRFIHRRKIKQLSTSFKLYHDEWDSIHQQIIYRHPDRELYLRQVEDYLKHCKRLFIQIIQSLSKDGAYGLEDIIYHFYFRPSEISLLNFVESLSRELIRCGQERTARAYRSAAYGLVEYNKGKDIPLAYINAPLIKSYEHTLKETGKSLNTISFYMRNLRVIYNKAIQRSYIYTKLENPFKDVYTGVDKTAKSTLSAEEIQLLHGMKFAHLLYNKKKASLRESNLYRAWRLFFFCFHTRGMSFVDMAYLRKDNIQGNLIRYYRKNTRQLIEVRITPKIQLLIDSFKKEVKNSPYLFPIIRDNQKSKRLYYESGLRQQNKCLKILALKAGIKQPLSTHVSRHSWAKLAQKENLPIYLISESLGYCDEKTTYNYLASLDQSVSEQTNNILQASSNE